jgi:hypothetical protein
MKKCYILQEKDFRDLGFRAIKIGYLDTPVCKINNFILYAAVYKFNSIDEIKSLDFLNDLDAMGSYLFLSKYVIIKSLNENDEYKYVDDINEANEFVFRMYVTEL